MNRAQVAGKEEIPDLDVQLDTCSLGFGRACKLCKFGNLAIVCIHASGTPCRERVTMIRCWRDAHAALCFADLLKLGPRAAIVERLGGESGTGSLLRQAAELDLCPGERDPPTGRSGNPSA